MADEPYYEMSIDGKKSKLTEKMAAAQSTREKKIPVEVNGRIIRIMPHMLPDIKKFGGTEQRRVIKEPPKELLTPVPLVKKLILPRAVQSEPLIEEVKPAEVIESAVAEYPAEPVVENPVTEPEQKTVVKKPATRKPAAKKK